MIDEKKLIEDMIEEIESVCGRKTNLTKKARKLLELKEMGDWIPCSEKLPEKNGMYIVTQLRYGLRYANDTKVKYLIRWRAHQYVITPLYNADGSLQIYEDE